MPRQKPIVTICKREEIEKYKLIIHRELCRKNDVILSVNLFNIEIAEELIRFFGKLGIECKEVGKGHIISHESEVPNIEYLIKHNPTYDFSNEQKHLYRQTPR